MNEEKASQLAQALKDYAQSYGLVALFNLIAEQIRSLSKERLITDPKLNHALKLKFLMVAQRITSQLAEHHRTKSIDRQWKGIEDVNNG